jgi:hypothetical protein
MEDRYWLWTILNAVFITVAMLYTTPVYQVDNVILT